MMRTSATEGSTATAVGTLREATRRLVHHTSNAANAAAVNVEVLRSRLARGGGPADALLGFAERASAAMDQVAAGITITRGLLATLGEAAAEEAVTLRTVPDEPDAVEVLAGPALFLDSPAVKFAAAAGVALRTTSDGVILKVLRRGAVDDAVTG